jgi:PhzF family phenazine biosynthesis protein
MEIPLYIIDAFSRTIFGGNPAAVCPLREWLPDNQLSSIAVENNQSETAFFVGKRGRYRLRWFTPVFEIDLCGHATLASAYVIFQFLEPDLAEVVFETASGELRVSRSNGLLSMDLPSRPGKESEYPSALREGLGVSASEVFLARDFLVIVESEDIVRGCAPKFEMLQNLPSLGIIVSAPGRSHDFVSRVFFPTDSIKEDPVTGSAHCTLVPYWSRRLGKSTLNARQISHRGGDLLCEDLGERVRISGAATVYSVGTIRLE